MFSLEIRINGLLVGCANGTNEFSADGKTFSYNIEYHRFNKDPKVLSFNVSHVREEGVEKLAFLVYKEVVKRTKTK